MPVPDSIQGRSLVPLLENKPSAWRSDFFVEHTYNPDVLSAEIHRFRGVRTTRWKYLGYLDHDYEELYDLDADPHELKNLAQDPSNASLKRPCGLEPKSCTSSMRGRTPWTLLRRPRQRTGRTRNRSKTAKAGNSSASWSKDAGKNLPWACSEEQRS